MKKKAVYIHTIDHRPGEFIDGTIHFARKLGIASAKSLAQIRAERRRAKQWDAENDAAPSTYGHVRVMLP